MLLKSDGTVAACGFNGPGQCDIPALDEGLTYVGNATDAVQKTVVVQLSCRTNSTENLMLVCTSLGGDEKCILPADAHESVGALQQRIVDEFQARMGIEVLLPDGTRMKEMDESARIMDALTVEGR